MEINGYIIYYIHILWDIIYYYWDITWVYIPINDIWISILKKKSSTGYLPLGICHSTNRILGSEKQSLLERSLGEVLVKWM